MPYLVQFGSVETFEIHVENDHKRNTRRFYAVALFKKHKAAKNSIQELNGKKLKGVKLYVDWYNDEIVPESGSELTIQEFGSNLQDESESSIIPKNEISKDSSPAIFTFESDNDLSSDIQKDIQNFINASNANTISNSSLDTSNPIIEMSQNEKVQPKSTNFFFEDSSLSEEDKDDINNLKSNELSENSSSKLVTNISSTF